MLVLLNIPFFFPTMCEFPVDCCFMQTNIGLCFTRQHYVASSHSNEVGKQATLCVYMCVGVCNSVFYSPNVYFEKQLPLTHFGSLPLQDPLERQVLRWFPLRR